MFDGSSLFGRAVLALCSAWIMFHPSARATVFVSKFGNNSTGDSWVNAYTELAPGVAAAAAGEEVWVAAGKYNIGGSGIVLPSEISLLGGFPNDLGAGMDDRDPKAYRTRLNGQDTALHVFACDNVSNVLIDGFILEEAAGGGGGYANGGAIVCSNGATNISIANCSFLDNSIAGYGGGINIMNADAAVTDCFFESNVAAEGGAVKVHQGDAVLSKCTFRENTATSVGGAISAYSSTLDVSNSIFLENDAPKGGGAECHEGTLATFVNCLFAGNEATGTHGGGLNFEFQTGILISFCTFAENAVATYGGGVFLHSSSGVIGNSIFADNEDHAIFENDNSADPDVDDCLFHDNDSGVYFDEGSTSIALASGLGGLNAMVAEAQNNRDGNPLFADSKRDDYHLRPGSAAIDRGSTANAPAGDIDGDARPIDIPAAGANATGAEYDIGFDEYDPSAILTVDKPNGGERLKQNQKYNILWHSDGYTGGHVRVELWRKGEFHSIIKKVTLNDGLFTWPVPDTLPAKRGYSVVVEAVSNSLFSDESDDTFRIKAPTR